MFGIFKKGKQKDDLSTFISDDFSTSSNIQIKDVLSPGAIKINSKNIELGNKIAKTFAIVSFPRFVPEGWFNPIINLTKEFNIAIHIHPIDSGDILKQFRRKVAQVEAQILDRQIKGMIRDPKLDTAHADLEALRDKLQQATEKIFNVGIYITLYGDTEEEIKNSEKEIRSSLEGKLIYIKETLFEQEAGFKSTIPLGLDVLDIHTKLNSDPLSSLFPFVSYGLSAEKGILFGINKHNSSLILFDRFSLPNYNSVTFARSGAGKSYAIKLEILRSLMLGIEVIVIDPENEFDKLATATDGRFFKVSLSSKNKINPFDIPAISEDETIEDVLRTHIINLLGLFKLLLKELTPEEDSTLDRALNEVYALKDITASSGSLSNKEPPTLTDFVLVLSGLEGGEALAKRLEKYVSGSWSGFLNQPSNINMNKQFIVFSIRDMEEELKTAAMYIITNFIWNNIKKNIKKRLLVVDEAWIMMKDDNTAEFLFGLVKRGRKYYLGVGTITQDVTDFLKSRYGNSILANSSLVLLLRQSPTSIDLVQETFKLTDGEKFILLEANVGEGLFIAGLKRVAIQIVASYTEDLIITTDPSQLLEGPKSSSI